jgi:methylglutaconyl-CoA hydratase
MLLSKVKDRIGIITLNRPEKRNAFNAELVQMLHEAIESFNANEDVRAILIEATGDAFSAGADLSYLKQLRSNSLEENETDSKQLADMFLSLYNSPKLTFSAVDGYALAGGCGLATITDFCYASANAHFGYTEVKIGFIPAIVLTFLIKKINGQNLNKLLLTGNVISAKEAVDMDLVSEVILEDGFSDAVVEKITSLVNQTSSEAVASTKKLIRAVDQKEINEALNLASKYNALARSSDDCVKGVDAFLNKTKITW